MKIENYERQLNNLQEYGLSFQSAICILEVVAAFTGYSTQANHDGLQAICDMYDVGLIFHQKTYPKSPTKMALTGIFRMDGLRFTFLYHDSKKSAKFCKTATEYHLLPNSDNKLIEIAEKIA